MELLIIDTIIEKVDASVTRLDEQEKAITEIFQKVAVITDNSKTTINALELLKKLQENINAIRWLVKEMTEMSHRLARNNELLANPVKTKQVKIHTAGKIGWVIAGLTVIIVSLAIQFISNSNKLDQYKVNDMMWRYIKIMNHSQNLEYFHSIERQFLENPEKIKSLVEQEELHQKQIAESEINNHIQKASDTASLPRINKRKPNRSK